MRLIVFEGPDGCGKSTQARMAYDWLIKQGVKAKAVNDPSSQSALPIRELLLNNVGFHPTTELLLYMAARSELVNREIKESSDIDVVLCDRFMLSTLVYQTSVHESIIVAIHKLLGLYDIVPVAHFLYMPSTTLRPALNVRDQINDRNFQDVSLRYRNVLSYTETPCRVCEFTHQSEIEVFEQFTKPNLIELGLMSVNTQYGFPSTT